jgi:hypothetical protein
MFYILKAIHSPTSPPMPLRSNDVKDSISAPHSSGITPPIVEPIKIANQTKVRDGMPRPYIKFVETPHTVVAGLSSQRSSGASCEVQKMEILQEPVRCERFCCMLASDSSETLVHGEQRW